MKVKLNNIYAGAKGTFVAGETIEVDDAEGRQLIDGGYAEFIEEPKAAPKKAKTAPKKETATAGPEETAMQDPAKEDNRQKPDNQKK